MLLFGYFSYLLHVETKHEFKINGKFKTLLIVFCLCISMIDCAYVAAIVMHMGGAIWMNHTLSIFVLFLRSRSFFWLLFIYFTLWFFTVHTNHIHIADVYYTRKWSWIIIMYVRDEYVLKYYYYLNINNIASPRAAVAHFVCSILGTCGDVVSSSHFGFILE